MLIVLEGLDGAGKSTQVKILREYLQTKCPDLEYIHFPRYDAPIWGDLISRFLKGEFGSNTQVHPQLVALLFALDRADAAAHIRQLLEEGRTVLLDRYVYSNIAYQCAKLPDPARAEQLRNWILDTEFEAFGEPRPELNIFLNVPLSFVEHNLSKERKGEDRNYLSGLHDIHEASIDFQRKVNSIYLSEAERNPSLKLVDCSNSEGKMLPSEDIFKKIKALVDEVL
ncbi:MAG: dTMP kinase [Candidatus Cryptobacteroides sp.]